MAFFKANEAYKEDPSKFLGRPKIPGYKDKEKGRHILIYDKQALGKRAFKKTGKLIPSGLPIEIGTKVQWDAIDQHGKPSHHRLSGQRGDRDTLYRQKSALETGSEHGTQK